MRFCCSNAAGKGIAQSERTDFTLYTVYTKLNNQVNRNIWLVVFEFKCEMRHHWFLFSAVEVSVVPDLVFANPAGAGFKAQLQLMIKKWCWTVNRDEFQFTVYFSRVAPRLPKTESAAVIHCAVLMLLLARSHDKWLTTKFVVWNKYGIAYSFPNPAKKSLALANISPEPDFVRIWKNRRISAGGGAGAEIRYSPSWGRTRYAKEQGEERTVFV